MPIATMSSKGQLTIPKAVREALLLDTGDEVDIELTGDGAAVLRPRHPAVSALFGAIRYSGATVRVPDMDPGSARES